MQRIERVEELFFCAVLAGQELHVVDEQHVHGAVLVAELTPARGRDGADHLIGDLPRAGGDAGLRREPALHPWADPVPTRDYTGPRPPEPEEGVAASRSS